MLTLLRRKYSMEPTVQYYLVKMWLLLCAVSVLLSSVERAEAVTSVSVLTGVSKEVCYQSETACGISCCPHPDAVCCNETQTCCRQGSVCLGSISICLGLKQVGKTPALYSERTTALRGAKCPSDTTTCLYGCCPLPNAVCCPGGLTCCPQDHICDTDITGLCLPNKNAVTRFLKAVLSKSFEVPSTNSLDNSISQRRPFIPKAGDNCCESIFGRLCCPDNLYCSYLGCRPWF